MAVQERPRSPRFMSPVQVWVKCKQVQPIHSREIGCIIDTVGGDDELVIVPKEYVEGEFVQGVRVGAASDNDSHLLVDFAYGDRVLVSEELTQSRNGSPVR